MCSYRQLTAITTVVSASIFYLWYRYCRKRTLSRSMYYQAYTQMALESFLCCGPLRKRKKNKAKNHAPYQKDLFTNPKGTHSENTLPQHSPEKKEAGGVEPVAVPDCTAVSGVLPIEKLETTSELLMSGEEPRADGFIVTNETNSAQTACQLQSVNVGNYFGNGMENEVKSQSSTNKRKQKVVISEEAGSGSDHDGVAVHIPNNPTDTQSLIVKSPENLHCDKLQQNEVVLEINRQCELTTSCQNGSAFYNTAELNTADSLEERTDKADPIDDKLDALSSESSEESVSPINIRSEFEASANSSVEDGPEDGSIESSPLENKREKSLSTLPMGLFDDPENDITECAPQLYNGEMIPCVSVPDSIFSELDDTGWWSQSYDVPAHMGGVIIGRLGKNVRELKETFNAEMTLQNSDLYQGILHLKVTCPKEHKDAVDEWIIRRINSKPSLTTIGTPNQLVRMLPLGQLSKVMVRSMYGGKELFVSAFDDDFQRYWRMQKEMNEDYATLNSPRMQLYEPITSGTVTVVPSARGFFRAVIVKIFKKVYPKKVLCFLLDCGVFTVVSISDLRKIRAKYMRICFQAIHVDWAHAQPVSCPGLSDVSVLEQLFSENRRDTYAFPVRNMTCCRQSVVFLEDCSGSPSGTAVQQANGAITMVDILAKAVRLGFYRFTRLFVSEKRQLELNCTDTPYYLCPNSVLDYKQLVDIIHDVVLESQQPKVDEGNKRELQSQQNESVTGLVGRRSSNRNGHRCVDDTNGETSNRKESRRQRKPVSSGHSQQNGRFVPVTAVKH